MNVIATNIPPVVTILKPINGSKFTLGILLHSRVKAIDPEDGNISSIMNWQSSIDGALGIWAKYCTSSLSQGIHTITASAIDSGQLSNSSSISDICKCSRSTNLLLQLGDHFKTNEDTPVNMNVIANDTDPNNDLLDYCRH